MAALYTGRQSILDAALGDYKYYGFELKEDADDFAVLYYKGTELARYTQSVTTMQLMERCKNHLADILRRRLEGR